LLLCGISPGDAYGGPAMIPEQYLSEIEEMAAIAQDAYGRGDVDECLMALDSIIENIENVMASLEAKV